MTFFSLQAHFILPEEINNEVLKLTRIFFPFYSVVHLKIFTHISLILTYVYLFMYFVMHNSMSIV